MSLLDLQAAELSASRWPRFGLAAVVDFSKPPLSCQKSFLVADQPPA